MGIRVVQLLGAVNNAVTNTGVQLSALVFHVGAIAGSYGSCEFNFLKNREAILILAALFYIL